MNEQQRKLNNVVDELMILDELHVTVSLDCMTYLLNDLHNATLIALSDARIYGDARNQLEIIKASIDNNIPIQFGIMAGNIGYYAFGDDDLTDNQK